LRRALGRLALGGVISTLLAAATSPARASGDTTALLDSAWPMYGHDAKHTFRSPFVGPADGNLLAPTELDSLIDTEAVVTSQGLFVFGGGFLDPNHVSPRGGNSLRGMMFGVRADGYVLWRQQEGGEIGSASGALDTNGFVYHGGRDNQLWKRDATSGTPICERYIPLDGDIKSSPTFSLKFPDRAYVPSSRKLFALGTSGSAQCTIVWQIATRGVSISSVSLADTMPGNGDALGDLVYAADRYVYRIRDDGASGTIVAQRKIGRVQGPTPLIHPHTGNIYVGGLDHRLHALRPDLSDLFPPVNLGAKIQSSAALSPDGETVYLLTASAALHAISTAAGTERAGFPYLTPHNRITQPAYAPVVDAEGTVYFGGTDGYVRAIRADGSVKWAVQIPGRPSTATIVDGGLIVPQSNGSGISLYRFCPQPTGPPTANRVCGFTVDTTFRPNG